jgi:hypothetical protein
MTVRQVLPTPMDLNDTTMIRYRADQQLKWKHMNQKEGYGWLIELGSWITKVMIVRKNMYILPSIVNLFSLGLLIKGLSFVLF